jgi:hypothetical protein
LQIERQVTFAALPKAVREAMGLDRRIALDEEEGLDNP